SQGAFRSRAAGVAVCAFSKGKLCVHFPPRLMMTFAFAAVRNLTRGAAERKDANFEPTGTGHITPPHSHPTPNTQHPIPNTNTHPRVRDGSGILFCLAEFRL